MKSNATVEVGAAWLMLVIVLGILLAGLGGSFRNLPQALLDGSVFVLLLTLAAPVVLANAVLQTVRFVRFGSISLDVTEGPAPGAAFQATVVILRNLPVVSAVEVSLALQQVTSHTAYEATSTDTTVHWSQTLKLPPQSLQRQPGRVTLPLQIPVPPTAVVSEERGHWLWLLQVQLAMAGPDLVQSFELPVQKAAGHVTASRRAPRG